MKMTLDNPAVLEQKLEALEHHKKVLENQQARRLQLAASAGGHQSPKPQLPASAAPKPHPQTQSLRTLGNSANTSHDSNRSHNNGSSIYENHQMLYENMKHNENTDMYGRNDNGDRSGHMYDGCQHDAKNNSTLIYSNITHGTGSNVSGSRNGISATKDMANPYSNISYDGNAQGTYIYKRLTFLLSKS